MAETLRARVRVLSSQSLIYGLSGTLTKLVGLIIVPILGSKFTPTAFAPIDLITAFASVIGSIILLGSDAAVAYYYFRETDERGKQDLVSTWMIFQFLLNAVVGAALFAFAEPITRVVLGPSSNSWYLRLTGCAFPLGSTVNYALEILRLQIRPKRYVLVSGSSVIAGLCLTLLLVVTLNLGLIGIYIASLCSNILAFAVATYSLRRSIVPRFSWVRFRQILAYGLPLVPISVSNWAIGLSNRFFIRAHGSQIGNGLSDTGLFGMGNRIAQLLLLAISAFALAWSPFALSISESPDAKTVYARVLTFYVAVLSWLTLALSLFAPLILTVVKPDYARSYQVVAPLAYAYAVAGAYPIVAMGTALSKKTIHLSWATIAAGLFTLVLNAILVPLPYMSLTGGAVATLCGNLLLVGLVYSVSQRLYPIPYEVRKVLTCAVLLAVAVALGQVLRLWLSPVSLEGLGVRLLAVAVFPALLVTTGVIERYEVAVLYGALHRAVLRRKVHQQ
jgi:O-antigen/teichoic acid export membrane protein